MNNLIESIKHFEKMLQKYPDELKYTYDFFYFFKSLPSINSGLHPLH